MLLEWATHSLHDYRRLSVELKGARTKLYTCYWTLGNFKST